jgi:hypothetical protein
MPPQQPPVAPEHSAPRSVIYLWVGAAAAVVLVGVLVASLHIAGANADYICTKVVENPDGLCTNGAWGEWQNVSENTDGDVTTTVQKRTYTGTRATTVKLQYLNVRTQCQAGYSQQYYGGNNGASGFHGGSVTTNYTACQLVQTQTLTKTKSVGGTKTTIGTDFAQTDNGPQTSQTQGVGSVGELETHADAGPKLLQPGESGLEIKVQPNLVRLGDTTSVLWDSNGATACSITATNGDSWNGLSGTKTSKPIVSAATYTLSCTFPNSDPVEGTATVNVVPTFQEL